MFRSRTYVPILAVVLVTLGITLGSAIPQVEAATSSKYLSVPARKQEYSMWCWAAVTQSVGIYVRNIDYSQCRIVGFSYGGCPNWGSWTSSIGTNLRSHYYAIDNDVIYSSLSFDNVKTEMNSSRPIVVYWQWIGQNLGHFVTIRGYYEDTSRSNRTIAYLDPGDGNYKSASYDWMVNDGSHQWQESIWHIRRH